MRLKRIIRNLDQVYHHPTGEAVAAAVLAEVACVAEVAVVVTVTAV